MVDSIKPISYSEVKTQVKAKAQELKESATPIYQEVKSELADSFENVEKKVIEPAFNAISEKTAKLVNEYKEPATQLAKKVGDKIGEAFKRIKF